MKMFYRGRWHESRERIEVRNPFNGEVVDTVPRATLDDVDQAVAGAIQGAALMAKMPAYDRAELLFTAAGLMRREAETLARTITLEEGKPLAESRQEVARATETMRLSAEEARRLGGEVLPLEGAPGGAGKLGFTLRVPCGVVVAITPFNFPLNLVCHKVGPALAAGNSVIVKPATNTPLVALRLVELLLEAGVPSLGVACVTGRGTEVGEALAQDTRVRKVTFTGSRAVGERICHVAGLKRVTMELGSNSPLIVMADADLEEVARAIVATGYVNAGQTCISTQRVIAHRDVYGGLLDATTPLVRAIASGDPLDPATQMGPLVREADARRIEDWLTEAAGGGARILTGGQRNGSFVAPAVVADVSPQARMSNDELFGPAVGFSPCDSLEEAIDLANNSPYGLSAGVFTRDLRQAIACARQIECGNIHINWGPGWRVDLMPYGGLKQSGMGKEGPRYAIEEMTELKTVVIHGV